jgi:hypothetical protein
MKHAKALAALILFLAFAKATPAQAQYVWSGNGFNPFIANYYRGTYGYGPYYSPYLGPYYGWRGYTTWSGGRGTAGVAFNPYTGGYRAEFDPPTPTGKPSPTRTYQNPYTGGTGRVSGAYNPYTGRYAYHYHGYD